MPLIQTKGSASSQAYGQFARKAVAANYIEDVFSTYLYTGNGSTQTITNGIDLSTKGGLLWIKGRSTTSSHWLVDTARGNTKGLYTDGTVGQQTSTGGSDVSGFSSSGFSLGTNQQAIVNTNGSTFASWTFRKQPKFFDIVTYTGTGAIGNVINHSLGVRPSFMIVKNTSASQNWAVMYIDPNAAGIDKTRAATLNATSAFISTDNLVGFTATNFDAFYIGNAVANAGAANTSGNTYVAYLFASDAGGFGASGTDSVIKCGTYTGNGSGSGPVVTLGWEPQWILIKSSSFSNNWVIFDDMRGMSVGGDEFMLRANVTSIENYFDALSPTATGFQLTATGSEVNSSGATYIYMAIRRGPMRTPTSGTSVFSPNTYTGPSSPLTATTGFPVDAVLEAIRNITDSKYLVDRLRGSTTTGGQFLKTDSTAAELAVSYPPGIALDNNTGFIDNNWAAFPAYNPIYWAFRRAPGFFDVVCYTGDGTSNRNVTHSLGVTPSFYIVKRRSTTGSWWTWAAAFNGGVGYGELNSAGQFGISTILWGTGSPTSTTFPVSYSEVNSSGGTFVAYLFADCPGVSKAGLYVGTGAAQTINCGFTGGARFVLIKRTTGSPYDWYVWDTARGISAGNDPYLLLNSTAAETTGTDYISVQSSGFGLTATAPAALNANGVNYFFLAIA